MIITCFSLGVCVVLVISFFSDDDKSWNDSARGMFSDRDKIQACLLFKRDV